jgi:hypothetical protein
MAHTWPDQDNSHARGPDAVGDFDVLARGGVPNFDGLVAVGYQWRCLVGGPA